MNEIQAYDKINDRDGLEMLGAAIQRSGMFGAETKEQGIILALQCMVEKKPPLEMAKNYHIIQGKLSKRADAMLADFRKAGGKFIFADLKNPTIQKARVRITLPGVPTTSEWSGISLPSAISAPAPMSTSRRTVVVPAPAISSTSD